MSRRALLLSLALHAAFLVAVWVWFFQTAQRAGPGESGAGVTCSAVSAGGLLVEIAPTSPVETVSPALPAVPDFTPAPPTLDAPTAPAEVLTAKTSPAPMPSALSPKMVPMKTAGAPGKSGRAARPGGGATGSGTGAEGSGLAGAGRGLGGGGLGYIPPSYRLRYKPPYPEEARAQRLEGTVLLLVSLDSSGRVTAAALQQTCGHGILDRAALKAVRTWLFEPARQDGAAIAAQVEIPIRFRFEERTTRRA